MAALIQAEVKKAGLKPMKRVHITWIWREPTKRRDPDNFISLGKKFCQDALVACRVLPNDGWANIVGYRDTWEISKEPGVLVILDDNVEGCIYKEET